MNRKEFSFLKNSKTGIVLTATMLLTTLTGCVGYVDGPRAEVAVEAPSVVVQDDYVYYPNYGIYYSGSRHQYASLRAGAWVSESSPRGVSADRLRASPSVRMDFHDSPANHHAAVARQYPKNWKPTHSNQRPGQSDQHDGK
jgi:hypothetical protein